MEEQAQVLSIKNMVCNRCILVITRLLEDLGFTPLQVELGTAVVRENMTAADRETIRRELEKYGFELIDDKRLRIIEQIRTAIIQLVHYEENLSKWKLSEYLQEKCHHEYSFLSKLFTEVNGISIEKYYIAQKVERIKELLIYDEWSVSEIAARLRYSSVAHMSTQFRQVTGLSPSEFKRSKEHRREPLDQV